MEPETFARYAERRVPRYTSYPPCAHSRPVSAKPTVMRTLARAMTNVLGASGFNRASIGIQCFDPVVQRAVTRIQSFDETAAAVKALRAARIEQISFDHLYGLPGQSVATCLDTVGKALRPQPDRHTHAI
jgi:coproporphyrinogen III oxidase-like Fe-S oxidoreductase